MLFLANSYSLNSEHPTVLHTVIFPHHMLCECGPVVSVGKEYRQTLFSAQYVKNGFTNGAVVCVVTCRG